MSQIANRFQGSNSNSSNNSSGDDATPKRHSQCDSAKSRIDHASPPQSGSPKDAAVSTPVVRTESHAARFNNARALFEKLGVESRLVSRPVAATTTTTAAPILNGKMSKDTANNNSTGGSDSSPDKLSNGGRNSTNGVQLMHNNNPRMMDSNVTSTVATTAAAASAAPVVVSNAKIFNVSRPKPEKPEKPERKFNSRELIEKQKNWTSHFSKARASPRFNSDPMRCDIIRTVPPGTGLINKSPNSNISSSSHNTNNTEAVVVNSPKIGPKVVPASPPAVPHRQHVSQSFDCGAVSGNRGTVDPNEDDDIPPCPPIRQNSIPEIKPRSMLNKPPVIVGAITTTVAQNVNGSSPVKIMVKRSPEASPEKARGEYNGNNINNNNNNSWTDDAPHLMATLLKKDDDVPERPRKKSFDLIEEAPPATGLGRSRSQSLDKENVISPGIGLSSSSSPMASISSEPTSPIHTEDEKQENEANEKTDFGGVMTPTDGIDKSEGTDSGE